MSFYLLVAAYILVVGALAWLIVWSAPKLPEVKSHDAIAEEIRAEKIELENTARHYADLQTRPELESYPASFVNAMMVAAFRSGALWQRRRDS